MHVHVTFAMIQCVEPRVKTATLQDALILSNGCGVHRIKEPNMVEVYNLIHKNIEKAP